MAWLHQHTVWQLCRLRMIVWALDAVSADPGHRCPALLPTCVIAGQGIRASFATERAPRIRVRRLRAANLCFAQQRSGNDKRCDDRHPHHGSLPVVVLACPHVISFAEVAERRAHSRTSIEGQLSQVKRPPTMGRAAILPSATAVSGGGPHIAPQSRPRVLPVAAEVTIGRGRAIGGARPS